MDTKTKSQALRFLLTLLGLHHLAIGILGSISVDWSKTVGLAVWGASVDPSPQYFLLAVLLNMYLIGFGLFMIVIAKHLDKYKDLLIIPVVVLVLQAFLSFVHFMDYVTAFQVSTGRTWMNIIVTLIFAALIWWLRPSSKK